MSLGLSKSISSQIIDQTEKWVTCSGPEWTVQRLKEIKLVFLHNLAGQEYLPKQWISCGKGIPKGPIKNIFVLGTKKLSKALTGLNAYTCFVAPKITPKQEKKFFSSMQSESVKGLDSRPRSSVNARNLPVFACPTLVEYCNGSQRGPGLQNKTWPEKDLVQMFMHFVYSRPAQEAVQHCPELVSQVISWDLVDQAYGTYTSKEVGEYTDTLGVISGIQEPGFKLRAVANPDRVLQCVLEPLKQATGRILQTFETDATFNQKRPIPVIQEWLRSGKHVYSVDLSDATNLFPWPYQAELLRNSLPQYSKHIDVMDYCARGPWLTKLRGKPEIVHFSRGQPLGLGPSFFTFGLAHNILLKDICHRHKLEEQFFVLGDDVVIGNKELHRLYRAKLDNLGCIISDDKTFSSSCLAEFAGYTILPDRYGKSFKWRMISDHSFLECAQVFGKKSFALMTKYQRAVLSLLGPIPKQFGGLGWSAGKGLEEFLNSPLGNACIDFGLRERELPLVYRNLNADLQALWKSVTSVYVQSITKNIPKEFLPEIELVYGAAIGTRVPEVSEVMTLTRPLAPTSLPTVRIRPVSSKKIPFIQRSDSVSLSYEGYYPILERSGDPRPTPYTLVDYLVQSLDLGDFSNLREVKRWLRKASKPAAKSKQHATPTYVGSERLSRGTPKTQQVALNQNSSPPSNVNKKVRRGPKL